MVRSFEDNKIKNNLLDFFQQDFFPRTKRSFEEKCVAKAYSAEEEMKKNGECIPNCFISHCNAFLKNTFTQACTVVEKVLALP
ncbi:hypothetical protein A3D11_01700 [Candidatus Peribacteria bacterium RIFCSPHIGHO2_02_FULL_49_16]|nr:MAG: hypothetical protein A2880_00810 [Candidatus Peribacteria bacterium RIFCSPHIGHO2_01_FULL_49_38]OGJ58632.1 MAG: hypothetical protein A3D11_01700 [Candidatus Peribacteria bacterium RIFCSPHIGHO2_02_FULL_49_16]